MPKVCKPTQKASDELIRRAVKHVQGELPEDKTCAICLDNCTKISTLHNMKAPVWRKPRLTSKNKSCKHVFCSKCIAKWSSARKYTCPICRTKYNSFAHVGQQVEQCTVFNTSELKLMLNASESIRKQFLEDVGTPDFSMQVWSRLNNGHTVSKNTFNQAMIESGNNMRFKDVFPELNQLMRQARNKLYGEVVELV